MIAQLNIRKKYLFFFAIVVSLVVISQLILHFSISNHEGYSAKINLSARQKGIGEEIIKLLLLENHTEGDQMVSDLLAKVNTLREKWTNSQTGLINGSKLYNIDGENSPKIQELYHQMSPGFIRMNELLTSIVAANRLPVDSASMNELTALEGRYFQAMTEVHSELLREQGESMAGTRNLGWLLGGVTAIMLVMSFIFIIRPTIVKLNRQNRELQDSNRSLEEAVNSKNEFISEVSRELLKPVNNIIGLSDMIESVPSPDETKKISRKIRSSSENLSRLLNDMVDYTLFHSNELELQNERFNLLPVLEELIESAKLQLAGRQIEMILDTTGCSTREIIQDKYRLHQVIRHLFENALQFTENGEIILKVQTVREKFNFVQLQFSVIDTGVGFDSKQLDQIFEVSTSSAMSKARKQSKPNFGLAICKMLVEKMGGGIWVESETLKGSAFHFTLVAEMSEISHEQLLGSLNGVKALVVDDNKNNLKILVRQLSTWGVQATPFNSPELVAELIGNLRKFDICLIDLEMPEMDGRQLAARIRVQYPSLEFPLIALSSANKQYLENSDNLFTAYITKPVKQSQLLDVLAGALNNEKPSLRASSEVLHMHHGLKVLIAQDNDLMRAVTAKSLKTLGCAFENVKSGKQVIEKVRTSDYDLLLVDVSLPEMEGIEVAKKIKASSHGKHQPVIIGLSENESRDKARCLQAGMDDCISYDSSVVALEEKINRFFEDSAD